MIILATHKIINLTDERLKFQIGNTTIKLEANDELEINLNELEHVKKPVMKRALRLLPLLPHLNNKLEVMELKQPNKDVFRQSDLEEEEKEVK